MLVGYARTSTADQKADLDAQGRELKAAGCEKIFAEQISSAAQRPKLAECLSFLREATRWSAPSLTAWCALLANC